MAPLDEIVELHIVEKVLSKFVIAAAALTLFGCVSSDQRSSESAEATLLDDQSCDILYTVVQNCAELGEIEKSKEACAAFGIEVRQVFVDTLQMDADFLNFTESYCIETCQKGIVGSARPRVEDVYR